MDATGRVHEVRGPAWWAPSRDRPRARNFSTYQRLSPGDRLGHHEGRYQMMSASGESFEAEIPGFRWKAPTNAGKITKPR